MDVKFQLHQLIASKSSRDGKRVTYRAISDATGINQNSIAAMIYNRQQQIALSTIARLCSFFDCDISDLMILDGQHE